MKNRKYVSIIITFILALTSAELKADRIYIVNSAGYNQAEVQLQTAITNNGHIVSVGASIPAGFESTCIDPINGYDWLCFFGNSSYTAMIPQMQAFIDNGGKVFYQYEVSCCTVSSQSAADVLTSLTGIPITPNANAYIALGGWEATGQSCCATFTGNAYKGLDGLPLANQLQATANINGSAPPISTSLNYGFFFTTTDFASGANQGGIIGVGDVNMWYDGDEPFSNGGSTPVSSVMVDYFFPNSSSTCYIFPPGCMTTFNNSGTFTFDLGPDTTLCTGQSLLLDVTTGGGTYLWQDNSLNSTFNVTLPGQYWVEVTGNCGVGTDTINVSFIAPPTIDLGNDTSLCPGQSLMLDATTVGSTYLWQDFSVAPTLNVTQQGLYWVDVSTSCGIITDSINVDYGATAGVDLGNDTVLCSGQSLLLDVTFPGASYLWQDNSVAATFNVSQAGQFWAEVTSSCGVASDTINVSFLAPQIVDLGNDTSLCPGQNLMLDVTSAGASYLWQDLSVAPNFNVTQQGLYWVEVSSVCGIVSDSINVDYGATASVDLGNDTVLCTGQSILLDVTFPGASYLWQDNSTNATLNVTQAGQFWAEVTSSCGVAADTINVSFVAPQTMFLGNDTTLCTGQSLLLDGTVSNSTYSWQDNSTAATFNVTGAGIYWVDVSTYCGIVTDSLQVYFNITPFVDLGNDTSICEGAPIMLDAFVATATYVWQDNSMASSFSPVNSGLYWVTASTPCGANTDSVQIEFIPPPTVDLGNDTTLCPGENFLLDVTGIDISYLWQDGSTDPILFVDAGGYITVQVTGDCGTASDQVNVLQANCGCELFVPNAFTPDGDQVNDIFSPIGDCLIEDYELLIFDRWGGVVFGSEDPTIVWDGKASGDELPIGVYAYKVRYKPIGEERREVLGSVTLVR